MGRESLLNNDAVDAEGHKDYLHFLVLTFLLTLLVFV